MKVYLVQVDNGETWEDYRDWIEKVYSTYRGASQYLINKGYEPYAEYKLDGELDLDFYWQESDNYMAPCSSAEIIEMELED